jgi:transcriptional regulator with XRE-family HTH domain
MVILSKFAENLSALMNERNIKAPALANILGTHRTNITRYLCAKHLPKYDIFLKIIDYFHVSADVLLGLMDYCNLEEFYPIQPFNERLRTVMRETQTSQYRLQRELHFSSATTNAWLSGKSIPSVEHIIQLADFMDVSVDYLLGRIK